MAYGPRDQYPPDEGCELHDRCLTCPFVQCIEDVEGVSIPRFRKLLRNKLVVADYKRGLGPEAVGAIHSIGRRQVFRILRTENVHREGHRGGAGAGAR